LKQITIKNNSIELTVLDFGAIIQKLIVNDKNGNPTNVVIGYYNPEEYLTDSMYLGACIGRYAGRISKGEFSLNGEKYTLFKDNNVHLHGGKHGFNQKYFTIEEVNQGNNPYIKLSYLSPDLEEGYPGNLKVVVTYTLIDNTLKITHQATTDKTTVINLTNHSYFKLDKEPLINHYSLKLNCPEIIEMQKNLLPTGALLNVSHTKYDYTKKKKIGETRLDTPFSIDSKSKIAAEISSEISGISMQVETNQPAVVIYTPPTTGSICFETQNFPDTPNHSHFPTSVLEHGETYLNEAIFRFSITHSDL
jgi:aldose 1-epimerase